jgi:hypothetical protein
MAIIIVEKFDSREATIGIDSPSFDLLYALIATDVDAENDAAVRAVVEATIPAFIADLQFQSYHVKHQGTRNTHSTPAAAPPRRRRALERSPAMRPPTRMATRRTHPITRERSASITIRSRAWMSKCRSFTSRKSTTSPSI